MTATDRTPVEIDRAQVLAHRVHIHGLDHADGLSASRARDVQKLAIFDLGVQDTSGAAALAVANRLDADTPDALAADVADQLDGDGFVTVWSLRGSPHVHRRRDLTRVAEAVWPLSDRDAIDRLGGNGATLAASELEALEGFNVAIEVMRKTIDAPMTKSDASAAVTKALPEGLKAFCRPCGVVHVFESLFRQCALPAGIELRTDNRKLVLAPMKGWKRYAPPAEPTATRKVIAAYLQLLGPGTEADAASLLGSSASEVRAAWPNALVPVRVGSRDSWFPARALDDLRAAPAPELVRLLPPYDPYLRGWDRDVLVPDRAQQKAIWKAIGNPGAVLVDGEIRGTWRPKTSGKKLKLTVTPFAKLPKRVVIAIEEEAELVAALRGATTVDVTVDG